jgi:hypothetical protein
MKRIAVVLVLVGFVLSGQAASGHRARFATEVTAAFTDKEPVLPIPVVFTDEPDTFSGAVSSPRAACLVRRSLRVWKDTNPKDGIAAVATTKDDGTWTVNKEDPTPGTYYVTVARRILTKRGHLHVCGAVRSGNITVE